jgi:glyoxylase-like metal-dependent hydrolase (beta-lactamase superfamily II)
MRNPLTRMFEFRDAPPEKAQFFWTGGPVRAAPGVWFQSAYSGVTAFETAEGLVLVDSGAPMGGPSMAAALRKQSSLPVHTVVFTHGHVDHTLGLPAFLIPGQAPPRVVAHRAIIARFDRYRRTAAHNQRINARQFAGTDEAARPGGAFDLFGSAPRPDLLVDDQAELEVGGLRFELRHARGETDDHLYVFCPQRGVLCPGDLFIWAVPNAGNPQKVQRYPWDWAAALRQMATLGARTMCPGHGGPVIDDPVRVERMLTETADYLETLVERTLSALEQGSPPHVDVVTTVLAPTSEAPWLQPIYDDPEFLVRNVVRYFGGWWSGRPSELKPAPRLEVAAEMARLAGGPSALVERAAELAAAGRDRLAAHLYDFALEAAPDDPAVQAAVGGFYERRAEAERSLMATNLFNAAARSARRGSPFR